MQIHNFLPNLVSALKRWSEMPSQKEFDEYFKPMEPLVRPMVDDFRGRFNGGLYHVLEGLNWEAYREEAIHLDPAREEKRVRKHLEDVERLLGLNLKGDIVLFGAFTAMDGYARFDQGTHRVYLGVDESHGRGSYLDVLVTHELTHVAREPLPEIWAGFGLTPKMSHDEFTENQPVIEHLVNEGFSCTVSEILNPSEDPWHYAYQTEDSLAQILRHGPAVDLVVHHEIQNKNGDYSSLYNTRNYVPELPRYAHYVWAWLWTRHLLENRFGGEPKKLLHTCAKDLIADALAFQLPTTL